MKTLLKTKRLLSATMLVLLLGLGISGMAQDRVAQTPPIYPVPPVPIESSVNINAIEVSSGTVVLDTGTKEESTFGHTFFGPTTGSYPGSITLSLNCRPASAKPGGDTEITGGIWTLPVYLSGPGSFDTNYAGSIYGTIGNGKISWVKSGHMADVYFSLTVSGGTQSWEGFQGSAIFVGTLVIDDDQKTTLQGQMIFPFN